MRSDALAGALPGRKKWLKIDLVAAGRQTGVDMTSSNRSAAAATRPSS